MTSFWDEEPEDEVLSHTLDGLGSLAAKAALRGDTHVTLLAPGRTITEELEYLASLAFYAAPDYVLSPSKMGAYVAWLKQRAEKGELEGGWGSLSPDLILTVAHHEPPEEEDRGVQCYKSVEEMPTYQPMDETTLRHDVASYISKVVRFGEEDIGEFLELNLRLSVHVPEGTSAYRKMRSHLNGLLLSTIPQDEREEFIERVREYRRRNT